MKGPNSATYSTLLFLVSFLRTNSAVRSSVTGSHPWRSPYRDKRSVQQQQQQQLSPEQQLLLQQQQQAQNVQWVEVRPQGEQQQQEQQLLESLAAAATLSEAPPISSSSIPSGIPVFTPSPSVPSPSSFSQSTESNNIPPRLHPEQQQQQRRRQQQDDLENHSRLLGQQLFQQQIQLQQLLQRQLAPKVPQLICTSEEEVCLPANYSRFQLPNKGKQTTVSIGEFSLRK